MGEQEKERAFVLFRNLPKWNANQKLRLICHVALPLREIYGEVMVLLCQPLWFGHPFGVMETLYNINQNESDEHITSITGKQIFMLL